MIQLRDHYRYPLDYFVKSWREYKECEHRASQHILVLYVKIEKFLYEDEVIHRYVDFYVAWLRQKM